jgi:hypothetical protein
MRGRQDERRRDGERKQLELVHGSKHSCKRVPPGAMPGMTDGGVQRGSCVRGKRRGDGVNGGAGKRLGLDQPMRHIRQRRQQPAPCRARLSLAIEREGDGRNIVASGWRASWGRCGLGTPGHRPGGKRRGISDNSDNTSRACDAWRWRSGGCPGWSRRKSFLLLRRMAGMARPSGRPFVHCGASGVNRRLDIALTVRCGKTA